jgi:excisionase family DNA binding protein
MAFDNLMLDPSRLAYPLSELAARIGVSRDKLYDEIKAHRLRARKVGRRTVVTAADASAYLESLPVLETAA